MPTRAVGQSKNALSRFIQNEEHRYRFHELLNQLKTTQAMAFANKLRAKGLAWRDLNCATWMIESSGYASPFHAWVCSWSGTIRKTEWDRRNLKELFFILEEAGGVPRDCNPRVLMNIAQVPSLFMFVWKHAPQIIDFNARVTPNNSTVLIYWLSDYPTFGIDRFVAKWIDRMTYDDAPGLNIVNDKGWSVLTVAIRKLYLKTVEALFKKIPAISLEPELDSMRGLSLHYALVNADPFYSFLPQRKKMNEMIDKARNELEIYRVSLGPMLCKTLYSIPIEVCAMIRLYVDRSPH